jgi:hypothetical protein
MSNQKERVVQDLVILKFLVYHVNKYLKLGNTVLGAFIVGSFFILFYRLKLQNLEREKKNAELKNKNKKE